MSAEISCSRMKDSQITHYTCLYSFKEGSILFNFPCYLPSSKEKSYKKLECTVILFISQYFVSQFFGQMRRFNFGHNAHLTSDFRSKHSCNLISINREKIVNIGVFNMLDILFDSLQSTTGQTMTIMAMATATAAATTTTTTTVV